MKVSELSSFIIAACLALLLHGMFFSMPVAFKRSSSPQVRGIPVRLSMKDGPREKDLPPQSKESTEERRVPASEKTVQPVKQPTLLKKKKKKQPVALPAISAEKSIERKTLPPERVAAQSLPEASQPNERKEYSFLSKNDGDETASEVKEIAHPASTFGKDEESLVESAVPSYELNSAPEYPLLARRKGFHGTVLIDVFVTARGTAGNLRLNQSSGYDMLDRSAMKAVAGWRFVPGNQAGKPLGMWVMVPVVFRLQD
jgi:protein TonB